MSVVLPPGDKSWCVIIFVAAERGLIIFILKRAGDFTHSDPETAMNLNDGYPWPDGQRRNNFRLSIFTVNFYNIGIRQLSRIKRGSLVGSPDSIVFSSSPDGRVFDSHEVINLETAA
jgi:hypothetical protein